MKIEGINCILRTWKQEDIIVLPTILNNHNVTINLRDAMPNPYTEKDAKEWIEFNQSKKIATNLAIAINNELVGAIGLRLQDDVFRVSAEIGYYLHEPFWGKGIMTEAVTAITKYAFDTFDINRMFAGVFAQNPSSMRVLEKAGYTLEGIQRKSIIKNGKIQDEHIYSILKNEI